MNKVKPGRPVDITGINVEEIEKWMQSNTTLHERYSVCSPQKTKTNAGGLARGLKRLTIGIVSYSCPFARVEMQLLHLQHLGTMADFISSPWWLGR